MKTCNTLLSYAEFEAGSTLYTHGSVANRFWYIISGRMEVTLHESSMSALDRFLHVPLFYNANPQSHSTLIILQDYGQEGNTICVSGAVGRHRIAV